jgi:hypothetical protein
VPDLPAAYLTNEYLPFHEGDLAFADMPDAPTTNVVTAVSTAPTRDDGRIASMLGVR